MEIAHGVISGEEAPLRRTDMQRRLVKNDVAKPANAMPSRQQIGEA